MPFSESMISTLKSNKNIMLDKSKRFRKTRGGYGKKKQSLNQLPKATPEELKALAKRLQKERQIRMIKVVIVTILLFLGLVYVFVYAAREGIIELLTS